MAHGEATTLRGSLKNWVKYCITGLGSKMSEKQIRQLNGIANYVALGRWMADEGFHFPEKVWQRDAVFDSVAHRVAHEQVLYLEFGVYRGESMRYWSAKLTHPRTQLHGFDSFEGLPHAGGIWNKGQFSVGGRIPELEDPRVHFFKGWFDQVLPSYTPPKHNVLVINMDADLYSSTIYVLRHLRPMIKPGTFLYFDDLQGAEHEPRAFHEFMAESGLKFLPVCAHVSLAHAFFECVA